MNMRRKTMYHLKRTDALEWFSQVKKCQNACPVRTDVPAYIKAIREGDFERAYRINRLANLFPAILGRVCTHPCEDMCRRGRIDEPVSICALKRAAADYSEKVTELPLGLETIKKQGKRVAVIGAGPAGLACANDLAVQGYDVVIYEALDRVGGMLNVGIPPFRIPRTLIQQEISRVMSALGVEIKLNTPIGEKLTLNDLRKEYDAIFMAAGTHKPVRLGLEGEELKGVIYGVTFMRKANLGETQEIGRKVVVLGGGGVAMDCARTAVRMGCKDVHLICLESRKEMPVTEYEVEEAMHEGVKVHNRLGLKRILGKDGKVDALGTIVCKSVFDSEGRFSPTYEEGSEAIMEADTIILAVGQAADNSLISKDAGLEVSKRGRLVINPDTLQSNQPGIFGGGDFVTGPRPLIEAIAQGHKAAQSIHAYLTGVKAPQKRARFKVVRNYKSSVEYDSLTKEKPRARPVGERGGFDVEVELGLTKEAVQRDAKRCFQCQMNVVIDSRKCILCGGCVDICPSSCIRMMSLDRIKGLDAKKGAALVMNEDKCIRCGLCLQRCPTKAIKMVEFSVEEV